MCIERQRTPAQIIGNGPRYCPSIEDKVIRFAAHSSHQIFLEPEGLDFQPYISEWNLNVAAGKCPSRIGAEHPRFGASENCATRLCYRI